MIAYMEGLSLTEADNLKKTISKLFRQTCIVQMRYDPVTLVPRDNPDYEICVQHKGFIEDYLSVFGCELVHDESAEPEADGGRMAGSTVPDE